MKNKSVKSQEEPKAWEGPQQMTTEMAPCPGIWPAKKGGCGKALQSHEVDGHHGGHQWGWKGICSLFWQPSTEQPQEACWCNPYQFSFRWLCGPLLKAVLVWFHIFKFLEPLSSRINLECDTSVFMPIAHFKKPWIQRPGLDPVFAVHFLRDSGEIILPSGPPRAHHTIYRAWDTHGGSHMSEASEGVNLKIKRPYKVRGKCFCHPHRTEEGTEEHELMHVNLQIVSVIKNSKDG